jgi:hypothetical protein
MDFNFGDATFALNTDTDYTFQGFVNAGYKYKLVVIRYEESHEKSKLSMDINGTPTKVEAFSKLIRENNPFIVERHFVAPITGNVVYGTHFLSNKQFLEDYPTLESFKEACQTKKFTRGGSEILDYENEYRIQCNMPNTVRVSVDLVKVE